MRLGTYDAGKTLLYVSFSPTGGSLWADQVIPANRWLSVSNGGVKARRISYGWACPILVVSKEGDKKTLGIGGVYL